MLKANRFVRNLGVMVLILSNSLEVISQTFTPTNILTLNNVTSALDLAVGNLVPGNTNKGIVIAHYASFDVSIPSNNVPFITLSGTTLSQSGIPYSGYNPNAIEVGDFNADGYDDITFSSVCNCSNAYILQGSSTGVFTPASITSAFNMSRSTFDIGKGSILNNGRISIVSGGNASTEIKTNTGNGSGFTFTNASNSYLNTNNQANSSWGFNIGDINGDGLGDIIAAYPTVGSITVFYNTGVSPYFNTSVGNVQNINLTNNGVWDNVHGVATGDIDGDGDLDISAVIRTDVSGGRALYVITNNGSGNFSVSQPITIATYTTWLEMADMNGDGLSDIVIPGDGTIKIYNSSNGSFSSTANYSYYFGGAKRVALSDINNDGYIDITAISSNKVVVLLKSPAIAINSSTLTNFSTCAGIESSSQSVSIQGTNLGSTAITVTAPSNYEISLNSSSNFGQSLTLAQTNGSVASTTIFIRLKSTASVGTATVNLTAVSGSNSSNLALTGTVTGTYTWTGATSTDPTFAGNWNPAAVPCSGANEVIPSGLTNYPAYTNLTIDAGTTLTVQTGGRLTVTGTLTNNGTLTIESGATFLQGTSLAGSGTYSVKQTVTGAGGATPTGRFWYMGLPINNLTRATAFGTASGSNRLWSWSESGQVWSSQITDATTLTPTTGYVFRTGATSTTLNFSGISLYSADASITGLTNSGGSFDGCHLMSNPYTAYLDWEQVIAAAGTTNLASTYCVRSFNSTNSEMVYDTYNATGDVSVNPSGVAMTQYIAPMQSFWITVNPSTTGTLSMTKAMLSHQAGAVGLKEITSFPAFARLNLVSGDFYDQVVVYTDANATAEFDDYDSKKFFLPNKAQVYCQVGENKTVINALKQGKAQTSAPLTVELPSTQVYKFEMAESFVENGLVILEDKQEGIFQDMGINPIYEFYGNSGVIADRFVLHFQLPNGTNNEGQAGVEDLTNGQIAVIANHDGAVTVALSADLTTSGHIQIFDGAGRLVAQKAITSAQTSLQLSNGMGVYFVRVQTPMKSETKKVMVY